MKFPENTLQYISESLRCVKETISVAESVSAGLLQFAFSQMPCASEFFKGGMTTYGLPEKTKFLNIDRVEAENNDCVTQNIANTMALNVAQLFETDWSIGITGYATAVKESGHKIYCYFSIAYKNQIVVAKYIELLPKTVAKDAQQFYVEFILGCLKTEISHLMLCQKV